MDNLYILISVIGFTTWAFFQLSFVKSSLNPDTGTRLLFPIIVPILSGIFAYIGYFVFFWHSPNEVIVSSLQRKENLFFLILSSLGLALAYFMYTLVITIDFKNAAIITVLNTLCLTIIAFVYTYENDEFIFKLNASPSQIIGATLTFLGVIIMKYGDVFFKDWFKTGP